MEDYKTGTNSPSKLIQQETMGMPEDVCRDFLRNVVMRWYIIVIAYESKYIFSVLEAVVVNTNTLDVKKKPR